MNNLLVPVYTGTLRPDLVLEIQIRQYRVEHQNNSFIMLGRRVPVYTGTLFTTYYNLTLVCFTAFTGQ
jgi:hypothetical protein